MSLHTVVGTFLVCLLALGLSACAGRTVTVQSIPDQADVSYISADQGKVPLGKTPVTIKPEDHPQIFSGGGMIEVSRDHFTPELFLIANGTISASMNVSIKLQELKASDTCAHGAALSLARGIASAQQQIAGRRYLEAENTLKSLTVNYPDLSVIYDLLGNMYYLQKDIPKAVEAYRKSYELDPGNAYTERLLSKLRGINSH